MIHHKAISSGVQFLMINFTWRNRVYYNWKKEVSVYSRKADLASQGEGSRKINWLLDYSTASFHLVSILLLFLEQHCSFSPNPTCFLLSTSVCGDVPLFDDSFSFRIFCKSLSVIVMSLSFSPKLNYINWESPLVLQYYGRFFAIWGKL